MSLVKDLLKYVVITIITAEARLVLRRYKPKILCVSGSVGKTSTKDAIATVVASRYHIRKSEKSYNSEFGVPLTILGLKTGWSSPWQWFTNIILGAYEVLFSRDYPEWLVLEVGADKPGEIRAIAKWLPCHIAVLTAFPDNPVHVEFFKSANALYEEDLQMAYKLMPKTHAIVNGDDINLANYIPNLRSDVISVGFGKYNDVCASHEVLQYDSVGKISGISFTMTIKDVTYHMNLHGVVGGHQIYSILSAVAVGQVLGILPEESISALYHFSVPPGRLRIIPGIKGTTIIDDTYNASPAAVEAGLSTLTKIKTKGRRIAVLGDMLELGDRTIDMHRIIGHKVGTTCDILIAVGLRSKFTIDGAGERGMKSAQVFWFDNAVSAGKKLQELLMPEDVVFVKGSQSMRMERVVEEVMKEPTRKEQLLCRQEFEWLAR